MTTVLLLSVGVGYVMLELSIRSFTNIKYQRYIRQIETRITQINVEQSARLSSCVDSVRYDECLHQTEALLKEQIQKLHVSIKAKKESNSLLAVMKLLSMMNKDNGDDVSEQTNRTAQSK